MGQISVSCDGLGPALSCQSEASSSGILVHPDSRSRLHEWVNVVRRAEGLAQSMLSSIKMWAWAFVTGVLMTVAMIAVWKVGAVEGGFVLTMVSTVLTLIIAVAGVLALLGETRDGRETDGGRGLDPRPPARAAAAAGPEQPAPASTPLAGAASKFLVQTQGGPAYVAETMTFASGSGGTGGSGEANEGGASHAG